MGRIKFGVCWLLALYHRWNINDLEQQRADYIKSGWSGYEPHIRGVDYSLREHANALSRLGWQ